MSSGPDPSTEPLDLDDAEHMARRFHALADPTRLRILDCLHREGEVSVGMIATLVGGTQQNVSKHLAVLRAERFVARRKQSTSSIYRVSDPWLYFFGELRRGNYVVIGMY